VALVLVVALVSGLAGGVVAVLATRNQDLSDVGPRRPGDQAASAAGAPEGTAAGDQLQRVLGAVLPAVVKVEARTDTGKATGSGVIFANGGYVLTNAHVVDRAQSIGVTLSTSEPLRARFVGRNLTYDLAVLKVRRAGLTTAKVGRSADLRVGDAAIVVGSPFGFQSSVTTGIVSALHRVVKVPDGEGAGEGRELVDAIQTDAAINPATPAGRWPTPAARSSASRPRSPPTATPRPTPGSGSPSRSTRPWRWRRRWSTASRSGCRSSGWTPTRT
jgi:putative serine protease PepD